MAAGTRPPRPSFFLVVLSFTAGVLATHALRSLPSLLVLSLLSLAALWPWRFRAALGAFAIGVLLTVWHARAWLDSRWPAERQREDVIAQGFIADLPQDHGANRRFLFEPHDADLPPRIRVTWYRADAKVEAGDCWRFTLRMRAPHGSLNPGGGDYESWLYREGIGATASVREAQRCEDKTSAPLLHVRQRLADRLDQWLPGHPALGLIRALVLGDRSGLSDDDWRAFRATGTSHIVAISGLHIGIVAGAAFFLFRWLWALWPRLCLLWPAPRAGGVGALAAGAVYAALAGFSIPTVRALIMLTAVVGASLIGGIATPGAALWLAWAIVLAIWPSAVLAPGLWLSFGACAAILYLLSGRLKAPGRLSGFLKLQLGLSVLLAPAVAYFFHGGGWTGPFANLVAVPAFTLLIPLLLIAVALAAAWPAGGVVALAFIADALAWLQAGLQQLAQLAPAAWITLNPPPAALALALFGLVLCLAPRGAPLRRLGFLCLAPAAFPLNHAPREGFELTALDVGQGLAAVVRTHRHTLLFDAGPAFDGGFDAGEAVVAPYLLHAGVRWLDTLLLSHGDNDHRGGADAVRAALPVRESRGWGSALPCRAGQRWTWDGVDFEILHPDQGYWDHNDASCVLRVTAGVHAALLPGDIQTGAEARLLGGDLPRIHADVLIAPHHGSATSSTAAFVRAVAPQLVIHPAGWLNPFRHPRPDVVARYAAIGATQFITGESGAVTVRVSAERGIEEVIPYRERAARFWNAPAEPVSP